MHLLLLEHRRPIVYVVVLVAPAAEQVLELPPQHVVIRFLLELQLAAVLYKVNKLLWHVLGSAQTSASLLLRVMCAASLLLSLVVDIVLGHASSISCSACVHLHLDKLFDRYLDLHILDNLILLCARLCLDPLPRQATHEEIDQHEAQTL